MSQSGIKSEIVLALVEEFLERYRQGERPPLRGCIDRHPDLAEEIRGIFLAVVLVENISLVLEAAAESSQAAATPEAVPVQQLGRYCLIRAIGHGGMRIVYEAEQVSLGLHVALKVLPGKMLVMPSTGGASSVRPAWQPSCTIRTSCRLRRRRAGRPALLRHAIHPGLGTGPGRWKS
jgi:hypothetical protein